MTRWNIEKSGTGIEKSGTGIEKSGTGIEKSGTGIEKSGTGIEKSGTGLRRGLLACSLAAAVFSTAANANDGLGSVSLAVTENGNLNVTWMFEESVFLGFGNIADGYANVRLMEVTRGLNTTQITGGGTGVQITGGGTGVQITGGGTGTQITGGGTGTQITGGGTGTQITGGGTGTQITGGGTGVEITGGGTGSEAVSITLPDGTDLAMEIVMSCGVATVYILDTSGYEVINFDGIEVQGATNTCGGATSFGGAGVSNGIAPIFRPYTGEE